MTWTNKRPTTPGWYWYRGPFDANPGGIYIETVCVLIEQRDGKLVAWQPYRDYYDPVTKAYLPGEWSGPIRPPD